MLGPTCFCFFCLPKRGKNFPGELSTFCTGGVLFYETTHHFKPFRFWSHINWKKNLHLLGPHRHKLSPKVFLFVGVGTHVFKKSTQKRNSTSCWKLFCLGWKGSRSNKFLATVRTRCDYWRARKGSKLVSSSQTQGELVWRSGISVWSKGIGKGCELRVAWGCWCLGWWVGMVIWEDDEVKMVMS